MQPSRVALPDVWSVLRWIRGAQEDAESFLQLLNALELLSNWMDTLAAVRAKNASVSSTSFPTRAQRVEITAATETVAEVFRNSFQVVRQCCEGKTVCCVDGLVVPCYRYHFDILTVSSRLLTRFVTFYQRSDPLQTCSIESLNRCGFLRKILPQEDTQGDAELCRESSAGVEATLNDSTHLLTVFRSLSDWEPEVRPPADIITSTTSSQVQQLNAHGPLLGSGSSRFWSCILAVADAASKCSLCLWDVAREFWACRVPLDESKVRSINVSVQQKATVYGLLVAIRAITGFVGTVASQLIDAQQVSGNESFQNIDPSAYQMTSTPTMLYQKLLYRLILPIVGGYSQCGVSERSLLQTSTFGVSNLCFSAVLDVLTLSLSISSTCGVQNRFKYECPATFIQLLLGGLFPLIQCNRFNINIFKLKLLSVDTLVTGLAFHLHMLQALIMEDIPVGRMQDVELPQDQFARTSLLTSSLWSYSAPADVCLTHGPGNGCLCFPAKKRPVVALYIVIYCLWYIRECSIATLGDALVPVNMDDVSSNQRPPLTAGLSSFTANGTPNAISKVPSSPLANNCSNQYNRAERNGTTPHDYRCYKDGVPLAINIVQYVLGVFLPDLRVRTDLYEDIFSIQCYLLEEVAYLGHCSHPYFTFRILLAEHLEQCLHAGTKLHSV